LLHLRRPHPSYLGVYARAATLLGTVVCVQMLGAARWMGPQLSGLLEAWSVLRAKHALPVTTVGAFLMYAASDTLSQGVSQQSEGKPTAVIDYGRAARTGISASILSGALAFFYYGLLERTVHVPQALWTKAAPGGLLARLLPAMPVATKVAIDLGVFEPVYDTLYITLQALLRGDGLLTAWHEVKSKVLGIWARAPPYWGPLDLINFSCVSLRLRPLFNALGTIPWSMYLSAKANEGKLPQHPTHDAEEVHDGDAHDGKDVDEGLAGEGREDLHGVEYEAVGDAHRHFGISFGAHEGFGVHEGTSFGTRVGAREGMVSGI